MLFNTPKYFFLQWASINAAMGFLVAWLSYKAENLSFNNIVLYFMLHQIYFQLVSFGCILTSLYLLKKLQGLPLWNIILYTLPVVLLVTVLTSSVGLGIAGLAGMLPGGLDFWTTLRKEIPEALLIASVLGFVFSVLNHNHFPHIAKLPLDTIEKNTEQGISIRENGNEFFVPFANILYLSAHGKITIVHTKKREYKVSRLLGEMAEMLPEKKFYRNHKSFMVNLNAIAQLKYFIGGSYTVLLNDEEETSLPLSRSARTELKKRISA